MTRKTIKSKPVSKRTQAMVNFQLWLKQFEAVYNLSPELTKNQIDKLKFEFEKIVKDNSAAIA